MLVVDASVVVSSFLMKEKYHREAKLFLDSLFQTQETILLPEIALPEIASAIAKGTGVSKYALDFCWELRKLPNFVFIPVDETISQIAVEIASNYLLKGADSIYVAVAIKYGCKFATLDRDQQEKASKIIKTVNIITNN